MKILPFALHEKPRKAAPRRDSAPAEASPELPTRPERARASSPSEIPDVSWRPLTRKQKTALVLRAKAAAVVRGLPDKGPDFNAWRQNEAIAACGRRIAEATQADWGDILARFLDLGRSTDRAFGVLVADPDNPRRIARHKLRQALDAAQLPEAYAAAICRRQYRVELDQASAKQLWQIFFTVKNRGKARQSKQKP